MNQVDARTRDFFDRQVLAEIKANMDSMNWMRFAAFYSLKPTKC